MAGASVFNDWQELAGAVRELGQLFGFEVGFYLCWNRDVMCCKVAGNIVEITRKELEERKFGKLYDAMRTAMLKAGIEQPEQFLVPYQPPRALSATEMKMQSERELFDRQLAITRRATADNQFKLEYSGLARLKTEGEVYYQDPETSVQGEPEEPQEPAQVVWREPRETPELELGEPSEISKLDVLMCEPLPSPAAPDLILDHEGEAGEGESCEHGTSKKAAS